MAHDFKRFPELRNNQMAVYYFESPHKQITENFTAKVIKVSDGDTIRVETTFRDFDFPIRFANIAAPELKERGGIASQRWLESEILNKEIEVIVDRNNRVGKWGRLIGEIISGGFNINEESLRKGFSVPFGKVQQGGIEVGF
jgi:endonuclease YncB( thermonuclease family)